MSIRIIELMNKLEGRPESFPETLLVYGAGSMGRKICRHLMSCGIHVPAVLDIKAKPGDQCEGVPLLAPAAWLANHDPSGMPVLIAIHNEYTAIPPVLKDLGHMGFKRILTPVDYYDAFPSLPFHYWLAPRSYYAPYNGELGRLYEMMSDEISRAWLEAVIQLRLSGDYVALPVPDLVNQYHPSDLPRWPPKLRYIDCGAFTGDTIQNLATAGFEFEAIAAFEPDLASYMVLVGCLGQFKSAFSFPCGVADQAKRIGFAGGQGGGSHIDPGAGEQVTCVALDEALHGFRANFIKMDVEGAELSALEGAKEMIADSKPVLAISVYHHPSHLWQIPFLINSWRLDYRFFLRGHGHSSFDLVVYAIPDRV